MSLMVLLSLIPFPGAQELTRELCDAIKGKNISRVEEVIDGGARPDARCTTEEYGETPALSLAAKVGDSRMVRLLHHLGANLDARTERFHLTPLMIAVENSHKKTVATLLDLGADPNARDSGNATAIMYAVEGKDVEIATLLIGAGANAVDIQGGANRTPLLAAIAHGNRSMVTLLIRAGADINKQGGELVVMSPLMLAASLGYADIVRELLDAGADANATSLTEGKTALDYAKAGDHREVLRLLTAQTRK